ncbi:hypothetical protein [Cupriavidus sp. CuC1]|uniref:hypothetical protein n=1 Tax=Cupriavidus sp. CuC1 TaxID=3373131 RepID=UPI0037D06A2B
MTMFTAAIFDMDGLLIDSERAIMQAWIGAARALGIALAASDYVQVIGKAAPESNALLVSLVGDERAFRQVQAMAGAIACAGHGPEVSAEARRQGTADGAAPCRHSLRGGIVVPRRGVDILPSLGLRPPPFGGKGGDSTALRRCFA